MWVLAYVNELGRPTLTEQHHSMAWGARLYKKERGVSTSPLLLPDCDTIWPAASGPCHMTSLPLTDCESE